MRNLENPSLAWVEARAEFEKSGISNRALAQKLGVSEKSVRNRIKAEGWVRGAASAPRSLPDADQAADVSSDDQDPQQLADRVAGSIAVLVAEFDTTVRSLHLLREIAEVDIDDGSEKAAKHRRRLIDGVLQLPSLVNMAERLTAAIARLATAGPGKKARANETAREIGKAGKFATPAAPGSSDRLQ